MAHLADALIAAVQACISRSKLDSVGQSASALVASYSCVCHVHMGSWHGNKLSQEGKWTEMHALCSESAVYLVWRASIERFGFGAHRLDNDANAERQPGLVDVVYERTAHPTCQRLPSCMLSTSQQAVVSLPQEPKLWPQQHPFVQPGLVALRAQRMLIRPTFWLLRQRNYSLLRSQSHARWQTLTSGMGGPFIHNIDEFLVDIEKHADNCR